MNHIPSDTVKLYLQLCRTTDRQVESCPVQVDDNRAVLMGVQTATTFEVDAAFDIVSSIHANGESFLFEKYAEQIGQFTMGVNVCLSFLSHEVWKLLPPHDILDGLMTKIFRLVTNSVQQNQTHDCQISAQFVGITNPSLQSEGIPLTGIVDLLSDSPESVVSYSPLSTFESMFHSAYSVSINSPEDALNCYVLGLNKWHSMLSPQHRPDSCCVFVLELRQTPRRGDVPIYSRLCIIDLPSYNSMGVGGELVSFLTLVEECQQSFNSGRLHVLASPKVSPLHELLIGEGFFGGNWLTSLSLFYEDRVGVEESVAGQMLTRLSMLRTIASTPLINDIQTVLFTTRVMNALHLLRQYCTANGGSVPKVEFDKHSVRHEVSEERLRGQLLLVSERYETMKSELVSAERERLKSEKQLSTIQEKYQLQHNADIAQQDELKSRLSSVEKHLIVVDTKAATETTDFDALRSQKIELEQQKHDLDIEYVALRTNYLAVLAENKTLSTKVGDLSVEVLNLISLKDRKEEKEKEQDQPVTLRITEESIRINPGKKQWDQERQKMKEHIDSLEVETKSLKESLRIVSSTNLVKRVSEVSDCSFIMEAVDDLIKLVEGQLSNSDLPQLQQRHIRQLLSLEKSGHTDPCVPSSFEDFLSGTYAQVLREKEDYKARCLRAEFELQKLEENTSAMMIIHAREKAQLQNDLSKLRGERVT